MAKSEVKSENTDDKAKESKKKADIAKPVIAAPAKENEAKKGKVAKPAVAPAKENKAKEGQCGSGEGKCGTHLNKPATTKPAETSRLEKEQRAHQHD